MSESQEVALCKGIEKKKETFYFLDVNSSRIPTRVAYFLSHNFHRLGEILPTEASDPNWCVLLHNFHSIPGKAQNNIYSAQEF